MITRWIEREAIGNKQEYGVDRDETFATVTKMYIACILLAIVSSQSRPLLQIGVKNAFLCKDLKEEVYMRTPQGLTVTSKNSVC